MNQLNVLGTELKPCSTNPLTGYFRDGCCHTTHEDRGIHSICAVMTKEFLTYSQERGNDLKTPVLWQNPRTKTRGQMVPLRVPLD